MPSLASPESQPDGDRATEPDDDAASGDTTGTDEPQRRSELSRSMAEATRRVEEIVEAAERLAAEIGAEAREEAERYLEARRAEADRLTARREESLRDLADSVAGSVARLRHEAESTIAAVESGLMRLSSPESQAGERPPTEPQRPSPTKATPASVEAPTAAAPTTEPGAASERAMLRATQMAVAGRSRAEIEAALRAELGVSEPGPLVDEILGPEG